MKVLNPKPASVDLSAPHVAHKDAVLLHVNGLPAATRECSFDEVRAALGKSKEQLPDGAIWQICQDAGIKCER